MFGKPKQYDPNKILIKIREIEAELRVILRKEEQFVDAYERKVVLAIKSRKKEEVYNQIAKVSLAKKRSYSLNLVSQSVKEIKESVGYAVTTKNSPPPELQNAFNIICASADYLKIDSLLSFKKVIVKELYGSNAVLQLSDKTNLDPQLITCLVEISPSSDEIIEILRNIAETKLNDYDLIEQLLGISIKPEPTPEEIPIINDQMIQPNVIYPGVQQFIEHEHLFPPIDFGEFSLSDWEDINHSVVMTIKSN